MVIADEHLCLHLLPSYAVAVTQNEPGTDDTCWQSKLSYVWVTEFLIRSLFRLVVSALPFSDEYYVNAFVRKFS